MCRLFGMSGGAQPLSAEFWLLDAPDSLTVQSHRNPDGTGLGIFDPKGRAVVRKAPISAFNDADFACEARRESSRTFLAHIRFASTGAITRETRRRQGDVRAGIVAAVSWVAEHLPVYSLNLILSTESELFALRYPETNTLYLLDRAAGGHRGGQPLRHRSSLGTRVHSEEAAQRPVVVLASEPMDDDPGWRTLESGELLHVGVELEISSAIALPDSPTHRLELRDLSELGHASQSVGSSAKGLSR